MFPECRSYPYPSNHPVTVTLSLHRGDSLSSTSPAGNAPPTTSHPGPTPPPPGTPALPHHPLAPWPYHLTPRLHPTTPSHHLLAPPPHPLAPQPTAPPPHPTSLHHLLAPWLHPAPQGSTWGVGSLPAWSLFRLRIVIRKSTRWLEHWPSSLSTRMAASVLSPSGYH